MFCHPCPTAMSRFAAAVVCLGLAGTVLGGCAGRGGRSALAPADDGPAADAAGTTQAASAFPQPVIEPAPARAIEPAAQPAEQPAVQPAAYQPPVVAVEPLPPASATSEDRPGLPIDLATALGLTAGQNPRIAFAQAQVAQAYAQYDAARVLWLPSLRAGMNYNKHEGRIQDVVGSTIETSRGAAFGGLGANAVGAGSPAVPGVYALFHTTDAIFQRRITGFALDAREAQSTATVNDQLLATALAYLELLEAMQRKAIAIETLKNGEALAQLTADFARTGAGNQADADRAAAAVALLRNEVTRTDEAIAVATARLAQQLSADPSLTVAPQEATVVPIELVAQETPIADMVALGLANRPELSASRSLVGEAVSRLRREEHALWLPSVLLGTSYGAFGAGTGGDITNGGDRFDFDAAAWWEVRNLGFGERAARDNARSQIAQARMREVEMLDTVAREVVEAQAQVAARRRTIDVAKAAITSAEDSYRRNLERIRNAQGLPIEVLQSIQALDQARREYLRSVVDYNQAQFRLHRALGWPISGTQP